MKKTKFKGRGVCSTSLVLTVAMLLPSINALSAVFNPPSDPLTIVAFPQRDFISASGYAEDDKVVVRVIHDQTVYPGATGSTTGEVEAEWITPQEDPANQSGVFAGIVEVNHPGGSCWKDQTPDIRPGDRVQIEVMAGTNIGRIDETTVRNVTAKRPVQTAPGTIVVHGTAQDSFSGVPLGAPLDLNLLEQRLVAPGELFDKSGKRTLISAQTGGDGLIGYDPIDPVTNPNGINWTATYNDLNQADIDRALAAESRGMWLGGTATEISIYEIGAAIAPGPSAPCNAPLEVLPPPPGTDSLAPSVPSGVSAASNGPNTVIINWVASTDTENGVNDNPGVTSYGVYRINGIDGIAVAIANVQKSDGTAPAPISYVDKNVPPGTYTYKVDASDSNGNRSAQSFASLEVTAVAQTASNVQASEPPANGRAILAFPSRDFVAAENYGADEEVTIQVIRNGFVISSAEGLIPDAEGLVEVNHPGGGCWDGVTPELRAGDIVRVTAYGPNAQVRSVDQIHVANVTAKMAELVTPSGVLPATVKVHGTAQAADGSPLPLDQIEQRLISSSADPFINSVNKRSLRAPGDGTISYDSTNNPAGINWTAEYVIDNQHDVDLALSVESRILWLGNDALAGNELTLFENGLADPPGPATGFCTAAIEHPDMVPPSVPGNFSASITDVSKNQVTFAWTPSSDNWEVAGYKLFDGGNLIAVFAPGITSHVMNNLAATSHTFSLRAFDNASPLDGTGDDVARLTAGLGNPYGNMSAPATLVSTSNPGGTTDLSDVTPPSVPTNLFGVITGISPITKVTLTWDAATDNLGVDHYILHRNPHTTGSPLDIDVGNTNTFIDGADTSEPLENDKFTYRISAVDEAGNVSAQSAPITLILTGNEDTVNPSSPSNLSAKVINPDPIKGKDVEINWEASSDDVGVIGYKIYRNGSATPIATVNDLNLGFVDANLPVGVYTYSVAAVDSFGNRSAVSALLAAVTVAGPPVTGHSLVAFPARDFISAGGYDVTHNYHFVLIRDGSITFASASLSPVDDLNGGTIIEVNHPGGACWATTTPDMRPGDVVRIVDDFTGVIEQTTVANVTAERPIAINANTVVIHGTAMTENGQPIPIDQLEQRLITGTTNQFDNGKRSLRAASTGADGTLAYDAPGSTHWTATYTNLSADDVLRAVGGDNGSGIVFEGAESRVLWLGTDPNAGTELTIFENGPGVLGGPSDECLSAPLELGTASASLTPANVNFGSQSFSPSTTSAAREVTLSNTGDAVMNLTNIYVGGANPGDFVVVTGGTCPETGIGTLNAGASCTVMVAFKPTADGKRQANLSFTGNAANTTDLTVALTGVGTQTATPPVPPVTGGTVPPTMDAPFSGGAGNNSAILVLNKTLVNFGKVKLKAKKDLKVIVKNVSKSAVKPRILINGKGFKKVSTDCKTLAANRSCNIVVRFNAPGKKTTANGTLGVLANGMPISVTAALTAATK